MVAFILEFASLMFGTVELSLKFLMPRLLLGSVLLEKTIVINLPLAPVTTTPFMPELSPHSKIGESTKACA